MPSLILVQLNRKGVGDLLKSAEVQADLLRRAEAIAAAAGPGYVADAAIGHDRAYAIARTGDIESQREEATNHALLRALHAGGGW